MTYTVGPIRNNKQHLAALAEIKRLWSAREGTVESDHLDVLMTLVDAYERAQWVSLPLDPIEAIKARMANSGRELKDFDKLVGSSYRATEILQRRRRLTLSIIWKLVSDWQIPANLLVQPYALTK